MGASSATALAALKIGGRVAFERLVGPKARQRDDVPCSPSAITPEWLTAVLCEKYPGAMVTQVEVKPASAGTHERHRLLSTYNEAGRRAGLPGSIFTKSLPSVVTRMIGGFNGTARVEGQFFTQLRPLLQIEAPVGYHAAFDRRTFASILLLEDLVATKSATFCNHRTYVTREMADDMIDVLAALHARFYGEPELATRYRWVAGYPRWFTIGAEKMRLEYYTRKAFEAASHVIPGKGVGATRRGVAGGHARACRPRRRGAGPDPLRCAYRKLVPDGGRKDGLVRLAVPFARPLVAGLRLRGDSGADAGRSPHVGEGSAGALSRRFAELTGSRPDFDESFRHYREQMVHALLMWTITLCHSPLLPNMQPEETTLTMIERITTAMADLDSIDNL